MPKKEKYCYECDTSFTVIGPKGFEVNYCPNCGNEVGENDDIDFEEETD